MGIIIPLSLAVFMALAIIVIGALYVLAPQRILGQFGLRPPAPDADTHAWLRLKGIRDIATGLVVLTLLVTTDARTVGIAFLAFALIPVGDMTNVLNSGGSKRAALFVHGLTAVVMVIVGLTLTVGLLK